jgi:hypothetical protein
MQLAFAAVGSTASLPCSALFFPVPPLFFPVPRAFTGKNLVCATRDISQVIAI